MVDSTTPRMRADVAIRPMRPEDAELLVELSLLAFVPVFESFAALLGPALFARMYPNGVGEQREVVERLCREENVTIAVAEAGGAVVGFVAYTIDAAYDSGTIEFLAVRPDEHNHGIGTELNRRALQAMREAGATLAHVSTGADPSHAPARRCYEKSGFTRGIPVVNYFQDLRA